MVVTDPSFVTYVKKKRTKILDGWLRLQRRRTSTNQRSGMSATSTTVAPKWVASAEEFGAAISPQSAKERPSSMIPTTSCLMEARTPKRDARVGLIKKNAKQINNDHFGP